VNQFVVNTSNTVGGNVVSAAHVGFTRSFVTDCTDCRTLRVVLCCFAAVGVRLYNTMTGSCLATLTGHTGEISKVAFNPQVSRAEPHNQW
jgi:WD40 repeat protein